MPVDEVRAKFYGSIHNLKGVQWSQTDGKPDTQILLKDIRSFVLEMDESKSIQTKPLACSLSQENGVLVRVSLYYSNAPESLDLALKKAGKLANEYGIAESEQWKKYVEKLLSQKPFPLAGSTKSVSVSITPKVDVSIILLASPNEDGWHVQSYFGSPL